MDTLAQSSKYPFNESMLSFDTASTSDSVVSDSTTTTSSTVPGLGEFSGKAILALGKATLRGAEYIIIRRRLEVISTYFSHRNAHQTRGIEQMYDDILELSRRDLYADAIRSRALTIILAQIGSRQARQLTKHLLNWPSIEVKIFVSELAAILDPFKLYAMRGTKEWPPAVQAYVKSLTVWESHCLEPFVVFLQELVDGNNVVGEAILEGGIKDYLLLLYVSNFFDPLVKEDPGDPHRTSTLYAACNTLLFILSNTQNGLSSIRGHPFHILWSNHPALPFTPLTSNRLDQRSGVWSSMSKDLILWRIRSIIEMVDDWHRPYEQEILMDIAVDVLKFSGSEDMGPEIYNRALRALHHFLTAGNNFSQKTILRYMVLGNTEYLFKIIPRMIARISQLVTMDTSGWDTFFLPWPQFVPVNESFFISNAILQIIDSFIGAAQNHQSFLAVLLEANLLGLLRPFLQQELQGIRSMAYHNGDNLLRYDASDFELLATLRKHGLRTFFPSKSDNPHIDLRRNILDRAVKVLLRRENDIDEVVIMRNEEREINQ